MKRFLLVFLISSLLLTILHFHPDFSDHLDCPVCVFDIDDGKSLKLQKQFKEQNFYLTKCCFILREKIFQLSLISYSKFQRAPPEVSFF